MEECVFCKIVSKEIPAALVYEDGLFLAFLDINPRSKGHTLIIPKQHIIRYDEAPEEIQTNIGRVLHHIAKELVNKLNATGFNILSNNGESAGQVVKHLHFHIIPRYGEKGHSLEAAFPVDENAKSALEQIYQEIGIIPPLEPAVASSPSNKTEEPKPEIKKQSSKKEIITSFDEDEAIIDQRDVLPDS
ncbi:MAG: HIT family protein [Candidatus Nanohaloarchaeota archaeon]|nr:HIT family protein [Candidatus Nanohaloarchaeota archaeon]